MGATEALASFAIGMEAAALPAIVVREARRHVIDCIGAAIAGFSDPCSRIITAVAVSYGGRPESTVWGDGSRTAAHNAALANGTTAHAVDYDDTNYAMPGHATVAVLPAVLAVGERLGVSGAQALAAYIAGVEVESKLGMLTGQDSWDSGWHTTSTLGVIGATAAVGRLVGLDMAAMRHALGIAVSQASGVRQNFGTMTKPLHVGHASWSAILAVDLAQRGFTASEQAVEGQVGYCNVFGGVRDRDGERMAQALGHPFEFETSRMSIKAFPCCGSTHGSIGAALKVCDGLSERDIESVMVEVPYTAPLLLIHHRPTTPMAAKFSLEYCVATALLHGGVRLSQFSEAAVNEANVQALLRRVTYRVPDEWQKGAGTWNMANARIEVRMKEGTVRRGSNSVRKGDAITDPLSDAELEAKFLDCAGVALGHDHARQLLDLLGGFERLDNVRLLTERLVAKHPAA